MEKYINANNSSYPSLAYCFDKYDVSNMSNDKHIAKLTFKDFEKLVNDFGFTLSDRLIDDSDDVEIYFYWLYDAKGKRHYIPCDINLDYVILFWSDLKLFDLMPSTKQVNHNNTWVKIEENHVGVDRYNYQTSTLYQYKKDCTCLLCMQVFNANKLWLRN